ncbi:GLUTATHIONE PEROXIDASE 2 family protein [Hibiscus syriacus]|uniref:GLUTATHIONE PEROXIDASE 2 family protein n=2 Tax=Hibiscus syriacus TaxID=106335 RepID=A0A6A3A3Z0_HIBSY|nr:GLUTATHIONE PEROXIDASE 2 family protein [Hibiscus syriacus]
MDQEDEGSNKSNPDMMSTKKNKKNEVLLEAVDELKKTKSLTGEDLDELKGCLDLGFGFSYDEIPELCNTLPALELCYSMSPTNSTLANWKISIPGDHPEDVKARLKFWAQAVACTVKLCN